MQVRTLLIRMLEDIYFIYYMYIARDLRETRIYYRRYTRERTILKSSINQHRIRIIIQ